MKYFSLIFLLCLSLIISCKNSSPSNIKTEEQNPPAVSASPVQNSESDFAENSYDDFHLIKVLASDGLEGWVVAVNLYLIENTHAKQSFEKISCTAKEKLLDSDMEIFGNESHPDEEAYFKANYRKTPGFECIWLCAPSTAQNLAFPAFIFTGFQQWSF